MQVVYLKDGQKANLVTTTERGYIVDPYQIYHEYDPENGDGGEYEEPSGKFALVDKVYDAPPRDVIEEEYKQLLDKVKEQEQLLIDKMRDVRAAEYEVSKLKNQKTDLSRYIINREELRTAKRLIVWPERMIAPIIMDGIRSHEFSVSYKITQYREEERCWAYTLHGEKGDRWSTDTYFDPQYGIKIDLTDEEILAITHERFAKVKKSSYHWESTLQSTEDKWLTEELIIEKKQSKQREKENSIEKIKKEMEDAQRRLDNLLNSVAVS